MLVKRLDLTLVGLKTVVRIKRKSQIKASQKMDDLKKDLQSMKIENSMRSGRIMLSWPKPGRVVPPRAEQERCL